MSYLDRLDFGLIVDRELVPDVWDLADLHIAEITRLFEATGAEWAQPPQPAFPRRGPIKPAQTAAAERPTTNRTARASSAKRSATKQTSAARKPANKKAAAKAATRARRAS